MNTPQWWVSASVPPTMSSIGPSFHQMDTLSWRKHKHTSTPTILSFLIFQSASLLIRKVSQHVLRRIVRRTILIICCFWTNRVKTWWSRNIYRIACWWQSQNTYQKGGYCQVSMSAFTFFWHLRLWLQIFKVLFWLLLLISCIDSSGQAYMGCYSRHSQ